MDPPPPPPTPQTFFFSREVGKVEEGLIYKGLGGGAGLNVRDPNPP